MTTYRTENPIGSVSVKDLFDNAENLDQFANSETHEFWDDRLGKKRKTWHGIENQANIQIDRAEEAADLSEKARDDAIAAASATGPIEFYGTYADALAAAGGSRRLVEVARDETRDGARTRYWAESGVLDFALNLDQLRTDLSEPRKGTVNVGFDRTPVAELVASTVQVPINALEISVWEFVGSVTKPDPSDHSTWDWTAAFQVAQAAIVAMGGGTLKLPRGVTYYVSGNGIQTGTSVSYYNLNPVVRFLGEGTGTVVSRREALPTDVMDFSDPSKFHDSAFNIHSGNVIVENLVVEDSKSAFYIGQKHGEIDTCSVAFCKFKSIWVRNCGVALHMRSGIGNYYNTFADWHVYQCQIGEYIDSHPTSATQIANNNRNQFRQYRNARCHVGLWLKRGDTNQFYGQHNEGNTLTPTANRYPQPKNLPFSISSGVAQLIEASGGNNLFSGCMNEANEIDLINAGERNSFSGLYRDEVTGKVRHLMRPYFYSTRTMSVTDGGQTFWFSNRQTDVFAGFAAGKTHYLSDLEIHKSVIWTKENAFAQSSLVDFGAVAESGKANVTIWREVDDVFNASMSVIFNVHVIGNCQSTSQAVATSFSIVALRNVSRTLTRHYIYNVVSGRATGAGVGDALLPFVPSLSIGGANGKDLVLTLTAPALAFDGVSAVVDRVMR